MQDRTQANPLHLCPERTPCERVSYFYDIPPDTLFDLAKGAVQSLKPERLSQTDTWRIESVHRVWFFRDDLDVLVTPSGSGAAVHLRSSSRVGGWDFGVNRRRIERVVRMLSESLPRN